VYKISDLMTMFNLSERTIRRHLREGILKGKKIGGSWRFDEKDISEYLDNPKIRFNSEKNNIREVLDFLNGVSKYKEKTLMIIERKNLSNERIRHLTEKVSYNTEPFYFNISVKGSSQIVTFIGEKNDAIDIINSSEENHA